MISPNIGEGVADIGIIGENEVWEKAAIYVS